MSAPREFWLLVRAEPGVDPIRALRAVLEALLRRYGLRCLAIRSSPGKPTKPELAA